MIRRDALRAFALVVAQATLAAIPLGPVRDARAQDGRARPIRLVVPFTTGGAPDLLARVLAQALAEPLGNVVVENRAGAGGNIGAEAVARSAPDGHVLLLTTTATHAINPALYPSIPYDPIRDFTPIAFVAFTPIVLVVSNALPVRDVRELVAWLAAHPGEASYASAGVGTMQHIAAELFKSAAHVQMQHVPYKGTGQLLPDLVSGRVPVMFNSLGAVLPAVREGKLRAIAVASPARLSILPELPTIDESGLPGFEASAWYGIYGPAGIPAPIVSRMHEHVQRALAQPAVRERLAALALEPAAMSPGAFGELTQRDLAKWTKIIRERGLRAE